MTMTTVDHHGRPAKMRCCTCGREKAWPDAFPSHIQAVCWECRWEEHVRLEHPPSRKQLREARRKAIRQATTEQNQALIEAELDRQTLRSNRGRPPAN